MLMQDLHYVSDRLCSRPLTGSFLPDFENSIGSAVLLGILLQCTRREDQMPGFLQFVEVSMHAFAR